MNRRRLPGHWRLVPNERVVIVFDKFKDIGVLFRKNFFFNDFIGTGIPVLTVDHYSITGDNFVFKFDITAYGDVMTYLFHDVVHHVVISATGHKFYGCALAFRYNWNGVSLPISDNIAVIAELYNILAAFNDSIGTISRLFKFYFLH